MEQAELRYLHFLGTAYAPARHAEETDAVPDAEGPEGSDGGNEPAETRGMPEPPGKALAEAIAAGLKARGWHCDWFWATYRGQALDARRVKRRYDIEVWLCEAEEGRWELVAEPRRGLFRKLFQQKPDPNEEALLRLHLSEVVEGLEGVERVSPWRRLPFDGGV